MIIFVAQVEHGNCSYGCHLCLSRHKPTTYDLSRHPFSNPFFLNCQHKAPIQTCAYSNLSINTDVRERRLNVAHKLFDKLSTRNEGYFSALIASSTRNGNFIKQSSSIESIINEGFMFDGFVLEMALKASSELGGIGLGKQLHGRCIRMGLGLDIGIRTALITMYAHRGMLDDAWRVFNETLISSDDHDVYLWNSIISACMLYACYVEALWLFAKMLSFGIVAPTELTYVRIVSACASAKEEKYGAAVHGMIIKDGLEEATNVWNSLITYYAKCGNLEDARRLFERISRKNIVSWNTIIASSEQNGEEVTAMNFFYKMVRVRPPMQPNRITLLSVLSAVSRLSALKLGREIHGHVIRLGHELDTSIANSIITMYSKCRKVGKARIVFKRLVSKDVITWNSLLAGYEQNEQQEACFNLFKKMLLSGIEPDSYTYTVILTAASAEPSKLLYLRRARAIHGYILRRTPSRELSLSISNAILAMFAKFNRVADAESIFRGMRKKDSYSWNAMMDGYSSNARFGEALLIFSDMLKEGLPLDQLSFSIVLTACSRLVSLQLGKQFHSIISKLFHNGEVRARPRYLMSIHNALVSMYAKCGSISDAAKVFFSMERRDVFSWTAMITGYAQHGMAYESFQLYERMKTDGVKPNHVTFLGLLMACAHGGLVEKGNHYFQSMIEDYGLNPRIEHYACMIDLFGRSGRLDHAKSLIKSGVTLYGPQHRDISNLWRVLLGACHAHKQLKLGVEAANKILELEPEDEATYIILANLYASSGMWEDALKVREAMKENGLKKEVGCSWIDVGNMRHNFVAGDIFHPQRKEIYEKLSELNGRLQRVGYVPMTEFVLHNVDEKQKEAIIGCHSEKLAVTFGLLQSGVGNKGIRVIKNLRVCGDCHNWMKLTSKVEGRDIILRDSRRFHHFRNGSCSCRDFW